MPGGPITLFLDFDGVLNNDGYARHQKNHVQPTAQRYFDPLNMASLNALCADLPIGTIVISSTWKTGRTLMELQDMLVFGGFLFAERITDVTPMLGRRDDEINAWIAKHRPGRVIVLDDMNLGDSILEGYHRVNAAEGLTPAFVRDLVTQYK